MPVVTCISGGRPGFRWGRRGRCYAYTLGDVGGRARAKAKAEAQGRAVKSRRDSRARRARIAPIGGVRFPKRREARYRAELEARVLAARDLVVSLLGEALGQFESEPAEIEAARTARTDAAGSTLPTVVDLGIVDETALLRMVDTARLGRARFPPDENNLLDVASGIDTFTTDQVSRVVETVVGIAPASTEALTTLHREWARTNVDLITSIDSRFFADIAKEVQEAVANGQSAKQLGKAIEARTGVATRRARLIARDQVASLNGQITKARQEEVGVSRYEWSTSRDESVRPDHEEREGVIFAWSTPPFDGHPGEPINCRCVAIPVFDTVEGVLEEGSIGGLADFTKTPAAAKVARVRKVRAPSKAAVAKALELTKALERASPATRLMVKAVQRLEVTEAAQFVALNTGDIDASLRLAKSVLRQKQAFASADRVLVARARRLLKGG